MKSFCIKTNNQELINYLLKKLEASSLENIYFISKEFKCYKNVIVHYLGKNISQFLINLSDILTETVLVFYEPILLQRLINIHYFYFDEYEKKIIENNCFQFIVLDEDNMSKYRKEEIWVRILHQKMGIEEYLESKGIGTNIHYPIPPQANYEINDEVLLYNIVKSKGIEIDENTIFAPLFGIHISPHSPNGKRFGGKK